MDDKTAPYQKFVILVYGGTVYQNVQNLSGSKSGVLKFIEVKYFLHIVYVMARYYSKIANVWFAVWCSMVFLSSCA